VAARVLAGECFGAVFARFFAGDFGVFGCFAADFVVVVVVVGLAAAAAERFAGDFVVFERFAGDFVVLARFAGDLGVLGRLAGDFDVARFGRFGVGLTRFGFFAFFARLGFGVSGGVSVMIVESLLIIAGR
jgi:hypothetical protein